MAGETREWADIDGEWLKNYLTAQGLAIEFDLDDVLVGAQISWVLGEDEWGKLRAAWEKEASVEQIGGDEALEEADEEQRTDESPFVLDQEPDEPPGKPHRLQELTQTALSDWVAFRELFQSCVGDADIGAWEKLADSPLALLKRAEKLVWMQEKEFDGDQQQTEEISEDDVTRAQNIIAGYLIYCRKHRLRPSLEHLQDFIPPMRAQYPPAVVREAWTRETGQE